MANPPHFDHFFSQKKRRKCSKNQISLSKNQISTGYIIIIVFPIFLKKGRDNFNHGLTWSYLTCVSGTCPMILNVFITKNHHSRAESPQKILRQESSGGFFARNNSSYKLHKHGKFFLSCQSFSFQVILLQVVPCTSGGLWPPPLGSSIVQDTSKTPILFKLNFRHHTPKNSTF